MYKKLHEYLAARREKLIIHNLQLAVTVSRFSFFFPLVHNLFKSNGISFNARSTTVNETKICLNLSYGVLLVTQHALSLHYHKTLYTPALHER